MALTAASTSSGGPLSTLRFSMVPLVEMNYNTPTSGPAYGNPMTLSFSAGVIYLADTYQVGVELVFPGNQAAGKNIGYIAQLHLFLDDLLPNSLGKPLFP